MSINKNQKINLKDLKKYIKILLKKVIVLIIKNLKIKKLIMNKVKIQGYLQMKKTLFDYLKLLTE